MDSRAKKEEVQIGRDRSVSVLGMPVGQRDGLALSPLKGVSLGNQVLRTGLCPDNYSRANPTILKQYCTHWRFGFLRFQNASTLDNE